MISTLNDTSRGALALAVLLWTLRPHVRTWVTTMTVANIPITANNAVGAMNVSSVEFLLAAAFATVVIAVVAAAAKS